MGETLSLESQIGTRMKDVSLGFTEPYFLDRPLQLGFVVYLRQFNYDQGREASILAGQNLIPLYNQLGSQNLLNYTQDSHGFNVSASYPLRRSFARLGITYGYDISNVKTLTDAATSYFEYINFSGVAGPNALSGIHTSHITPSYSYNTVNHPITPTGGRSLFISADFAGSVLGGNVNTLSPTIDAKYFKPAPWHKSHILAFHLMGSLVTGYGGKYVPPFSRSFMGGEQDIRGFEIWGITPIAFIPSSSAVNVLNADGTARTQNVISGGTVTAQPVTMTIPSYQLITPGGDTRGVFNFEYRIPIVGPVILAPFLDAGVDKILRASELTMDTTQVTNLNTQFPQANFDGKVIIAPGTQKPRVSTGLELQVMLPVVNAPFRLYFAYNPSTVREYIQPPIVADRSMFPNAATFANAVAAYRPGISVLREADDVPLYDRQDVLEPRDQYDTVEFRSFRLKKNFAYALFVLGVAAVAHAQTAPSKVAIIHIQNAILATKDGQKAQADLTTKFSPRKEADPKAAIGCEPVAGPAFQRQRDHERGCQEQAHEADRRYQEEGAARRRGLRCRRSAGRRQDHEPDRLENHGRDH